MSSFLEGFFDGIVSSIRTTPSRDAHAHTPVRPSSEDDPETPELARSAPAVVTVRA